MLNPYRISQYTEKSNKRWGATAWVKFYIQVARILRIRGYHQMHNWFRYKGELIHNRLWFADCTCVRCNPKARIEIKTWQRRDCRARREQPKKEYIEKYPMY